MGSGSDSLTAGQMRAARGLLDMKQAELAGASGVSVETIKRMEGFSGQISANPLSLKAVREALEGRGVAFLPGGAGVRLAGAPEAPDPEADDRHHDGRGSAPRLFDLLQQFYALVLTSDDAFDAWSISKGASPYEAALADMTEGRFLTMREDAEDWARDPSLSPEARAVAAQLVEALMVLDYPNPDRPARKGRKKAT
jgi:transcriptional regulator with XRE-family HTH domain